MRASASMAAWVSGSTGSSPAARSAAVIVGGRTSGQPSPVRRCARVRRASNAPATPSPHSSRAPPTSATDPGASPATGGGGSRHPAGRESRDGAEREESSKKVDQWRRSRRDSAGNVTRRRGERARWPGPMPGLPARSGNDILSVPARRDVRRALPHGPCPSAAVARSPRWWGNAIHVGATGRATRRFGRRRSARARSGINDPTRRYTAGRRPSPACRARSSPTKARRPRTARPGRPSPSDRSSGCATPRRSDDVRPATRAR